MRVPAFPVSPGMAIVRRELITGLRNKKPFYFVAAMLIVMIFSAAFMLYAISENAKRYGNVATGNDVRLLFMLYSMGLYAAAALLIPPMAAVAICIEKQQGNFDLLKMTYIRPLSIAVAKFFNVLGIYALVAIATLPIAGLFFFLVGIDWIQFTQSLVVLVASSVCFAAVGIFCSAWLYRTLPAVIVTYGICIFLQGGFLLLLAAVADTVGRNTWLYHLPEKVGRDVLFSLMPPISLWNIGETQYSFKAATFTATLYGGISALAFYGALRLISRAERSAHGGAPAATTTVENFDTRRSRLWSYFARGLIADRSNPILQKELRSGLFGRRTHAVGFFFGSLMASLLISGYYAHLPRYDWADHGYLIASALFLDTCFLLLIAPAFIATAFAKEHEWGNWDVLQTTLLKPRDILSGKLRAALVLAAIPLAAAALGTLPLLAGDGFTPTGRAGYLTGMGTMMVSTIYLISLTLLATVGSRHSMQALLRGYGASALAIIVFSGAVLFYFLMGSRYRSIDDRVERVVNFASPLLAQAMNMKDNPRGLLTWYWASNTVCFAALSVLLLWGARRLFTRQLSRSAR